MNSISMSGTSIDIAATKPFGFMRFAPGPGVGGHCLPIDPSYLSWQSHQAIGQGVSLCRTRQRRQRSHARLRRRPSHKPSSTHERKPLNGSTVLVLGLTYKGNSGDAHKSTPVTSCRAAHVSWSPCNGRGSIRQRAGDVPHGVTLVDAEAPAFPAADAVLILADHDTFDWDARRHVRSEGPRHAEPPFRLPGLFFWTPAPF